MNAQVVRQDHPIFNGYAAKTVPVKYTMGQPLLSVSDADRVRYSPATLAATPPC